MDERFPELLEQCHDRIRRAPDHDGMAATEGSSELGAELSRELESASECLRLIDRVFARRGAASQAAAPVELAPADDSPERAARIGRFEIVRELGRGAHGIVFLAWDAAARRQVAIKSPHPEVLFTAELRQRFLHEGIAAARLSHPNIVSVLEVDQSGPVCYIVSPYSAGKSLASLIAELPEAVSPRQAAAWVAQLADGVEHAHRHGILHRDVKPANILIEPAPRGMADALNAASAVEWIPKLTDFGLAKILDSQQLRTHTGTMLGTPAYMAPEQVDGTLAAISPATDVYGLGAVLYELLAGRPPFAADTQADLLRQVAEGQVRPPRAWRAGLPRDLEAICLRCLERQPRRRYASAASLAADLRRFANGEVTHARPLGAWGKSLKWSRRHPAATTTLAVSLAAVLVLAVGAFWHLLKLDAALELAEQARQQAEDREQKLRRLVYYRDLQSAHRALEEHDVGAAGSLLERHRDAPGIECGFLWRHLLRRTYGVPRRVTAHRGHVHSVALSADGQLALSAGADGLVRLWDLASGKAGATFDSGVDEVIFACFSPDGTRIAAAESTTDVRLWDVASGGTLALLKPPALTWVNCLAFSPDGRRLAAAGTPAETVVVWDLEGGPAVSLTTCHVEEINSLAFSPDGRLLLTASSDGTAALIDVENVRPLRPNLLAVAHATCARFSHDGKLIATCGDSGIVQVWNADDWQSVASFDTREGRVNALAFLPDGTTLAFADQRGVVRCWNWQEDRVRQAVDSRQGRILSLATDGDTLATAAREGTLCFWNLDRDSATWSDKFCSDGSVYLDDRHLLLPQLYGQACALDVVERSKRPVADAIKVSVKPVRLSPDTFVSVIENRIERWSVREPSRRQTLCHLPRQVVSLAVSSDRCMIATGDVAPPYLIRLWDTEGRSLGTLAGHTANLTSLAFHPHGELLASTSNDTTVRLWHLDSKSQVQVLEHHRDSVLAAAFSSDGRLLATAGDDRAVRFWDAEEQRVLPLVLTHRARVNTLAFCPDERLLVTGDALGNVSLWTLDNGEELISLGHLNRRCQQLEFSPAATSLMAMAFDGEGETRIWHAPAEER